MRVHQSHLVKELQTVAVAQEKCYSTLHLLHPSLLKFSPSISQISSKLVVDLACDAIWAGECNISNPTINKNALLRGEEITAPLQPIMLKSHE